MSLTSLEEKAVEVKIDGVQKKVVCINGIVSSVTGRCDTVRNYTRALSIGLNGWAKEQGVVLLEFRGTSPVRKGDIIRAGLVLGEDIEKRGSGEALYIEITDEHGHRARLDFRDGYNLTYNDSGKIGLNS